MCFKYSLASHRLYIVLVLNELMLMDFSSEELMIDSSADEMNQYLYDMICVKDSPSSWPWGVPD